jgi:predicted small secreted protein
MSRIQPNETTRSTENSRGMLRSRFTIGSAILGAALFAGVGCNTTEGVGEDISATGDAIDETAEDARE